MLKANKKNQISKKKILGKSPIEKSKEIFFKNFKNLLSKHDMLHQHKWEKIKKDKSLCC